MSEPVDPAQHMGRRLLFSWLVVLIPIGYGIFMTAKSISPLFGG